MWKGIDISDNQGAIDWEKVKNAGCKFAILRTVRRSGKPDKQFTVNLAGCLAQNIPYEFYKYTYALTEQKSEEEAEQVINLLIEHNVKSGRIWWDVEDKSLQFLGRDVLTRNILAAMSYIISAGYEFGIYTGKAFYEAGYFDTSVFSCPFWVARYPSSEYYTLIDNPPADKYKPTITQPLFGWQYTSRGKVNGIGGDVDLNACYIPFWETQAPEYYLQDIWHGTSISKALESIGEDGSYQHREQIAAVNGIVGYVGTAVQNTHMLNLLRTGQLRKV